MDLLDNYKKAWENQPEGTHKISRNEIFKMMHAKSSSIVKWIFIIGLCELILLPVSYSFFDFDEIVNTYEAIGLSNFIIISTIITVPILLYFIYQFYRNYKSISVIDNTKNLMSKILKTRKTVKNYVIFNLIYLAFILIVICTASFDILEQKTNANTYIIIFFIIVFLTISILVFWLFYQLLYGFLLKKLNKNYKELAKLEELN